MIFDPRLNAHAVDASGKWTGSVVKILDVNAVQAKWGKPALQPGDPYYRISLVQFLDENEAAGDTNIHVSMWKGGLPVLPARVWFAYPTAKMGAASWDGAFDNGANHGEGEVYTYATGQGSIGMGGNHGFNPAPGSTDPGCYLVTAFGLPSECAYGFDLPANRHVAYVVAFEEAVYGDVVVPDPVPVPDPDPVPTPTPVPAVGGLLSVLISLLGNSTLLTTSSGQITILIVLAIIVMAYFKIIPADVAVPALVGAGGVYTAASKYENVGVANAVAKK